MLVALLAASPPAAQAAPPSRYSDAFETLPCPSLLPDANFSGFTVTCGYLSVPERHAEPTGKQIQLAVVIIHSTSPSPSPDPLVMMQGGPGGSTIDTYVSLVTLPDFTIVNQRDIVLFDQRGTLHSKPNLICKEDLELTQQTIEQRLEYEEGIRLSMEATQRCRQRLLDEGVNLAAYNSIENAADIQDLRRALGYDEINLYGVSYGTLLAQHVMANYPEGVRSVILDAVAPTSINFIPEVPRSQERAFAAFFAACAADAACSASYPALDQTFERVVARLDEKPARIPMRDPKTSKSYSAFFSGSDFRDSVFQLLYATEFIPLLPAVIDAADRGRFEGFSSVMPLLLFDRTMSIGMYMSVICAEDADFTLADVDLQGVRDTLAANADSDAESMFQACQVWDVPALPSSVDAPVQSSIPTLLLSGQFDPITPPAFAERVAETLPNSTSVVFPNTGHGAIGSDACAMTIANDFLANPADSPDTRCASRAAPPNFVDRGEVVMSGFGPQIIEWLNGTNLLPAWTMLALLAFLLSLFLVWPVIWLVRALSDHRKGGRSNWLSHGAALVAAAVGPLALFFIVIIFAALMMTYLDDPNQVYLLTVGVPSAWLPLMVVVPLIALCALAMAAGTLILWAGRLWSVPERVYYTLLTLAALLLTVMMGLSHFFVNPFA